MNEEEPVNGSETAEEETEADTPAALRDAGYALRVVNTPDGDPVGIAGAVESLLEQGVDGVVVSAPVSGGSCAPRAASAARHPSMRSLVVLLGYSPVM
jgi:hypothetical protein